MDCCNYGQYGAGAAWDGYGAGAGGYPAPYAPYAHGYYAPPAHDPYARYYRYDYQPHQMHHAEYAMPMDYGAYAAKEARARQALTRREQRAQTPNHLPLTPTPPLDIGHNGRGPTYGEPQIWSHYQMSALNGGWNGAHGPAANGWSRGSYTREQMRYASDCRQMKALPMPTQNAICHQDGKATPYPVYDDAPSNFNRDGSVRPGNSNNFAPATAPPDTVQNARDRGYVEPRQSPVKEKRPPIVPLPAFQQAFGSTEIGKFAEAFSRTEVAQDDTLDSYMYDSYSEWDGPTEPQWSTQPAPREIKCEDNY